MGVHKSRHRTLRYCRKTRPNTEMVGTGPTPQKWKCKSCFMEASSANSSLARTVNRTVPHKRTQKVAVKSAKVQHKRTQEASAYKEREESRNEKKESRRKLAGVSAESVGEVRLGASAVCAEEVNLPRCHQRYSCPGCDLVYGLDFDVELNYRLFQSS